MEYLKVAVAGRKDNEEKVSVLINGQKNGIIGNIIQCSDGYVEISVDLPGAIAQTVNLELTTASQPKEVEIKCD